MAARDIYHEACARALEKDGWAITHDPLIIPFEGTELLIDFGAEQIIGAERNGERIAVEVKSFIKPSPVQDLRDAIGQYILYGDTLAETPTDEDRTLFLAVRDETYRVILGRTQTARLLRNRNIHLLVFSAEQERILEWIK